MINNTFRKLVEENASIDEIFGKPDNSLCLEGNYVLGCIRLANRVVYEMAVGNKKYHGMGTTVAAILITPTLVITANVGDSRIYLVRDGKIEALSRDHTIVAEQVEMGMMTEEEAEISPMRHVLTRNLGSSDTVIPDIFELEPSNNDRFILCSDGLTDLVTDEEILKMTQKEDKPNALCQKFIDAALKRGAHDNTTVISVFLSDFQVKKEGFIRAIGQFFADIIIGIQKTVKKIIP
jgi:protein phosphatase